MPIVLIDAQATSLPHLHRTLVSLGLPVAVHRATPLAAHDLPDTNIALLGPGVATLEMVGCLSALTRAPIVCVSDKHDPLAHVGLLEAGAIDVVHTSVNARELAARLRVRLRRQAHLAVLDVDTLHLNPARRTASVDGQVLPLAPREYMILAHLAHHAGSICSREALLDAGWGSPDQPGTSLDTHLSNVRRHLRSAGAPNLLRTVRGQGWMLHAPPR